MDIKITTRRKEMMRYSSCGDYFYIDKRLYVDICEQPKEDMEFCILIHELIEEYLTKKRGITEKSIMNFDLLFEEEREKGLHGEFDEPGYDQRAPYRKEHIFAENIERLLAQELGLDWQWYEKNLKS